MKGAGREYKELVCVSNSMPARLVSCRLFTVGNQRGFLSKQSDYRAVFELGFVVSFSFNSIKAVFELGFVVSFSFNSIMAVFTLFLNMVCSV